ncbi:MAG: hypothetical protein M3448_03725 [Pseudomonadota bacterium]|nr:hypothetical protein [Pseudomonadota bacterium]
MIEKLLLGLLALAATSPAWGQAAGGTPLFTSSEVLRVTIKGPLSAISKDRSTERRPGTISVAGGAAAIPVTLATRGLTRRRPDICPFPPLWVRFSGEPPLQSAFAGQKSLKLVTHCRGAASFQQNVLLEYAAYRMYNALSPASFKVRLAMIDYVDDSGKAIASRYGFFIEDLRDVARRNGMQEAKLPPRIPTSALSLQHASLFALFQHMIANHDWSMRAGPAGDECCHNAKLIAPARGVAAGAIPVPYDFDFSGLVNASYATPPDMLKIANVRQRLYRGYCGTNNQALASAVQFQAAKPAMLDALRSTPGLEERTIQRATSYLDSFFADIATPESLRGKVLKTCVQ